jgi:hypothetical protein
MLVKVTIRSVVWDEYEVEIPGYFNTTEEVHELFYKEGHEWAPVSSEVSDESIEYVEVIS